MKRNNIPTAQYENFSDFAAAAAYINSISHRVVVKVGPAGSIRYYPVLYHHHSYCYYYYYYYHFSIIITVTIIIMIIIIITISIVGDLACAGVWARSGQGGAAARDEGGGPGQRVRDPAGRPLRRRRRPHRGGGVPRGGGGVGPRLLRRQHRRRHAACAGAGCTAVDADALVRAR